MSERILIVEDEKVLASALKEFFESEGYVVETATSVGDALSREGADVVVLDVRLPDASGIDAIPKFKSKFKDAEVIMMTAYEKDEKTAVRALRLGAFDYITKPFRFEELLLLVEKAIEKVRLKRECESLKKEAGEGFFGEMVGISDGMKEVFEKIKRVARTNITILVCGESGTGKELVARTIHRLSGRKGEFVAVNCAAIPKELMEAELFGYEKGAFTGASSSKMGLIEKANRGTLFLDEIGDMPLELQGKLLRFLEDRRVRRVGGRDEVEVDVRVVSATNKDLQRLVEEGGFRKDLYYRVSAFTIELPPLRRRKEDIPLLVKYILREIEREMGRQYVLSSGALKALLLYDYPGNVRELKNILQQAALMSDGVVMYEHLPAYVKEAISGPVGLEMGLGEASLDELVAEFEKSMILKALSAAGGSRKKAAEILKVSMRSLRYKLKKYGLG